MVQILRDGCAHMRQAFDIESINLDDLIATALNDPKALGADIKAFHGINFADLNTAYHQFCKNENVANPVVDLGQVIEFFNNAAADLPDQTRLKGRKLPSMSAVLDGKGGNFANVFEPRNRRVWVPLANIPDLVQKAFIAAEDRRFFQHHGVDERGIIRAFIGNLADPGRPQGGSTITQQVVKNLLVGDDVTYERKIREMIVASRLEARSAKTKSSNSTSIRLISAAAPGAWRWPRAAISANRRRTSRLPKAPCWRACSKARAFSIPTGIPIAPRNALLTCSAACRKTAASRQSKRKRRLPRRRSSSPSSGRAATAACTSSISLAAKRRRTALPTLTAEPYTVHSTINAALQREAEAALQEGLRAL